LASGANGSCPFAVALLFGYPSAHNFKISGQLSLELAATASLVAALHIQLSVRYAISAVENLSNRKERKDRKERTTPKTLPLNSNAPLPPNDQAQRRAGAATDVCVDL
jgi:hypothetical protein